MILILIASAYITILCWCWGLMLFKIFQAISNEQTTVETNGIVICFSGLALIGVIFTMLSFFLPLGGLVAHACLALPAIIYSAIFKKEISVFITQYITSFKNFQPFLAILLIALVAVILLMGAYRINHPDTLHYHAQCIKWIQDYRAVPGLANLGYHYGLQSSWFIVSALFSFKFSGFTSLTFANCTVIFWLIFFCVSRINECFKNKNSQSPQIFRGIMWLLLLIASFWSYTQVRLTATSASPDFIAVLYIWLIFFLAAQHGRANLTDAKLLLLVFISLFAITIKLSSLPVILLALYYYRFSIARKSIAFFRLATCVFVVCLPSIIRNIITSGYPLFPVATADFFDVEWKIPKEILFMRLNYIGTYARLGDTTHGLNVDVISKMSLTDWIPIWWHNRSLADKAILSGLLVLFSGNPLFFRKIPFATRQTYLPLLFFSITGLIFWFVQAPDPRFGFGFIIVSEGILMHLLSSSFLQKFQFDKKIFKGSLLLFAAVLICYSVYRAAHFFRPQNILMPSGIVKLPFKTIQCRGVKINLPVDGLGCGDSELPCVYENCTEFIFRGPNIGDGFKPANGHSR